MNWKDDVKPLLKSLNRLSLNLAQFAFCLQFFIGFYRYGTDAEITVRGLVRLACAGFAWAVLVIYQAIHDARTQVTINNNNHVHNPPGVYGTIRTDAD